MPQIKDIIKDILARQNGYVRNDLINEKNSRQIEEWESWYVGKTNWHSYKIYNGHRYIKKDRMSLQMAKRVCEDWANLLMNEKTDITLSDEKSQQTLEGILEANNFWLKANKNIEKTFALGIGAWTVSIDNLYANAAGRVVNVDAKIKISMVHGEKVFPITIKDGEIIECAFVNTFTGGANIVIHLKNEVGNYVIHSLKATNRNNDDNYTVDESSAITFDTKNNLPWFFIIQPNIANNIDIDNSLGMSIFANSLDTMKGIDTIFDSYINEFILGRKRILVDSQLTSLNPKTGEEDDTFDAQDTVFYQLPPNPSGQAQIQDISGSLRITEHQVGLQHLLNILSTQVGFGTEHYKFDSGSIATATQIISENSDMFRNIKKQEILLEEKITALVHTIIYATNTFTSERINPESEISVQFDDSIIEDKTAERANDRLDMTAGILSKAEYRAKWYGESLEEAQKKIDELDMMTIPSGEEGNDDGEGQ